MASKRRKEVEVTILDQKFIMAFDMTSVDLFKEIHKDSFIKASASIGEFDDKTLLDFAAATIRRPDVSLSMRCTIPGRITPLMPDNSFPQ